ncbi:nitroreductase family protein [Streptomyces sp. SP17BM10]|uniref:Acg family FMN-binding oxidoreductase n=1 Tax=Streptomyces sp. SP17BM10 TaxID=3002530 RepID=UPI002E760552|nr:nitroreductase family protein [Streptomyces sp. SP17BM10]MEE1784945.1 nitroreductase family protein [Streptomyces sp. SP17BM10]
MTEPALTLDDLRLLTATAGAAPSIHNSQPWRFRPAPDARAVLVYGDEERAVPVTDPFGRALHISVGAAVFNLRVAAGRLGRDARVRLIPDSADPHLLAEIDLSQPAPRRPFGHDLYASIQQRHSSRQPFANRDVPETVIGELISAARDEGVTLVLLEEDAVRRVLTVTAEAEQRIASDLAKVAETRSWLRVEEAATDGIPATALGPQDPDTRVPMRTFTPDPRTTPTTAPQRFEALPQLCTLSTTADHPEDWLRTGQALEHVWLLATAHGLRVSVLHQAVEYAETRWHLRGPDDAPEHVQLVLRLGYGPPGAATPRRPVDEILDLTGYQGDTGGGGSAG